MTDANIVEQPLNDRDLGVRTRGRNGPIAMTVGFEIIELHAAQNSSPALRPSALFPDKSRDEKIGELAWRHSKASSFDHEPGVSR